MISSRYGATLSLLLTLALIPTFIHSYYGLQEEDGLTSGAIPSQLEGLESTPTKRQAEWVQQMFASDDWIERDYHTQADGEIRLFVARSYDLKRLYHHPELAALYGIDFQDGGIAHLPQSPEIPVHLLRARSGRGTAAYVLLYADRFVDNPFLFQLQTSMELILGPRKPLTLFLVYDARLGADSPFEAATATRLLLDAIEGFRTQQTTAAPQPGGAETKNGQD